MDIKTGELYDPLQYAEIVAHSGGSALNPVENYQDVETEVISPDIIQVDNTGEPPVIVGVSYDGSGIYNVGTTNLTIFEGLVSKIPLNHHYVYFRDGQYSYKCAYGDISLNGHVFSGSDVTVLTYDTRGAQSGQTWITTYTENHDSNFRYNAGNYLCYSDLGNYPDFSNREVLRYAKTETILFGTACVFGLLLSLRFALFRNR